LTYPQKLSNDGEGAQNDDNHVNGNNYIVHPFAVKPEITPGTGSFPSNKPVVSQAHSKSHHSREHWRVKIVDPSQLPESKTSVRAAQKKNQKNLWNSSYNAIFTPQGRCA